MEVNVTPKTNLSLRTLELNLARLDTYTARNDTNTESIPGSKEGGQGVLGLFQLVHHL